MTTRIDRKIVKYRVQKPDDKPRRNKAATTTAGSSAEVFRDKNGRTAKVIRMHEKLERPEMLDRLDL